MKSTAVAVSALLLASLIAPPPGGADEGMWTFDNFPIQTVQKRYGFAPSRAWLDHVRRSSLRLAGCSGSFISAHGLVMTNHHCVANCVQQLSTPQQHLLESGFIAKVAADERTCPAYEADLLETIVDVTATVHRAIGRKTGNAANLALNAEKARLEQSCGSNESVRCDLVSLYHGGIYQLYRYTRYNDVRLVFAPEFAAGQFGGDPDNFNFPRYDFDIGILRVYVDDHPLDNNDYFRWSAAGSKPGELVFVSGNPGNTSRGLTTAQLAFERDRALPRVIPELAELRGEVEEFGARGPEQARETIQEISSLANRYKVLYGQQSALNDPAFFAAKQRDERRLRELVAGRRKLSAAAQAWNEIAQVQSLRGRLFERTQAFADLNSSRLMRNALLLVRAAEERTLPSEQRLPEFTDRRLVAVRRTFTERIPVYKDLDAVELALAFTYVRRDLGPDDPFVHALLGTETPDAVAERLVSQTRLDEQSVRAALYAGGKPAIAASDDALIRFALRIDPELRAHRKTLEAEVETPTLLAAGRIADARFAVLGTTVYPDATFTARLSYGSVKGFTDLQGRAIPPYTTIGGLFARATGAAPFALPSSWLSAKDALDLTTPMNFSTTNDIIGGNSGSPVIDSEARIVGLAFDGNVYSHGGAFAYDGTRNRAIAVDSRALIAGLRSVYHVDRIVDEIQAAR